MAEVFDLDAAKAAQQETLGEPFEFSYAGDKYSIPRSADWPVEISAHFAGEDALTAMRELLSIAEGPEVAERFFAAKPTNGHIELLLTAAAKHEGLELPNSSAPPQPASPQT